MSGKWFTDIRHFPAPLRDAGINREARQLRDYLGRIVSAATAALTERAFASTVPCRLPGEKVCSGHLLVHRLDGRGEIHWACPVYEKSGVISGWQKSFWDLSGERERVESVPEEELLQIRVSPKTFKALNEISYLDRETEQILVSGVWEEGAVVLLASADDFDELLNVAAAETNHIPHSRDRRRMSEALREMEELLSGRQP